DNAGKIDVYPAFDRDDRAGRRIMRQVTLLHRHKVRHGIETDLARITGDDNRRNLGGIAAREIPEIAKEKDAAGVGIERDLEALRQRNCIGMKGFIAGWKSGAAGLAGLAGFPNKIIEEFFIEPQTIAVD